jgi:hypothetical protein
VAVVIKLSVGVLELFVHGGAMCFELFPRHSSHKARYIVESEVVRKTIIRTLPVETIESMKHRRTTGMHKLKHTQKAI